jgi:type IV secretory pathway VirB10-like protein
MIRLTASNDGTGKARPPLKLVIIFGFCTIAIIGGGVWVMAADGQPPQQVNTSPDARKIAARGEARRREGLEQAARLKQKDVGDEFKFDDKGNLLEVTPDVSDLPANRHLAQVAPSAPVVEGVQHRREEPAVGGGVGARPERFERELLTRSMLAYSTVRSASWAAQRPAERAGSGAETGGPHDTRRDGTQTEERILQTMERMGAGDSSGGGAGQPTRTGSDGFYPASRAAQTVRRGEVGDMLIGNDVGPPQLVRQGKFLDCAIVNELQVDLVESPVTAMVSRDFISLDGSYVIVPAGSRLLGTAGTVQNLQQARVYIKFERIVYPDQRTAYFPTRDVSAVDGMGSVGVAGDVNRHFMLQFGAAIMLGVLDGLAASVQSPTAIGSPAARDLVLARTSSNFSNVVAGVLNRYANVMPTVTIPAASKMKVFFAEDVRMSPYLRTSDLSWMRR